MSFEDLRKFWNLVVDVWANGVGGVDIGQALNAILILFAFFVLRGLIAKFLIGWLRRVAKSTAWRIDDDIVDAIAPPLRAIPVVFGIFVATNYMQFDGVVETIAENLTRTLIAVVIFWGMLRSIQPFSRAFSRACPIWLAKIEISSSSPSVMARALELLPTKKIPIMPFCVNMGVNTKWST